MKFRCAPIQIVQTALYSGKAPKQENRVVSQFEKQILHFRQDDNPIRRHSERSEESLQWNFLTSHRAGSVKRVTTENSFANGVVVRL
jgi:hypothetical protein